MELNAQPTQVVSSVSAPNNKPYLIAVLVMVVIGVLAVVVIHAFSNPADDLQTIGIVIGLITPTTLSLLALMKAQETHLSVNSRLDSFITTSQAIGKAEGFKEGRTVGTEEANARTDALGTKPSEGSKGATPDAITVNSDETLVIKKEEEDVAPTPAPKPATSKTPESITVNSDETLVIKKQ